MAHKGMRTVAVRNIGAHKVRMVLSILAVVLGTAFVSGSFTFTNTLQQTFDDLIYGTSRGVDAVVQPAEDSLGGLPMSAVDDIEQLPGVRAVDSGVQGPVVLMEPDGTPHQTGGAPSMGLSWSPPEQAVDQSDQIVSGRGPEKTGEIALQDTVAEKVGYSIGDTVTVYEPSRGPIEATLVGEYSSDLAVGGFVGVYFSAEQAAELFTDGQHVGMITVAGDGSLSQAELAEEIRPLAAGGEVSTGQDWADEQAAQLEQGFTFMNYFFVAFGLIALLVGSFIIFNTFSMLVAQRMRELALLRAIGASRRQVIGSVLVEAALTGLAGSALGVLLGFGLAKGIFAALDALDLGLPNAGLSFSPQAVIVPLVLGVVITVVSALVPAWRAGHVAPVQAMSSGLTAGGSRTSTLVAGVLGALGLLGGIALAVLGAQHDTAETGAILVGCGAFCMILSSFLVMPLLAPLIGGGIGRVIGAPFGTVGKLAATNAGRNSWRTAATAFSLTLGLALVAAFGTIGASLKQSIDDTYRNGINADVVVQGAVMAGPPTPLPMDTLDQLAGLDGVAAQTGIGFGGVMIDGKSAMVFGLFGPFETAADAHAVDGDIQPHDDSAVVSETLARDNGWQLGTEIPITGATGTTTEVPITGIFSDNDVVSGIVLGPEAFTSVLPPTQQTIQFVFLDAADGTDPEQLVDRASEALSDNPVATVQTMGEMIKQQAGMIDQMLNVIYALLALALIIAVLGIVNTLALSVIERRTELGMLRAIGTQRAQVRRTIILESTQIAIFGALIGAAVGAFLGWAFVSSMSSEGLTTVAIPWPTIAVVLAASALVGVLAALWPAYRAAKTSPLEAIAEG